MLPLPNEILSHIFLLGIEGQKYDQLHDFRMAVSAVDRYWRQVTLSTALLWAIVQDERQFSLGAHEGRTAVAMFKMLLERSRGAKLDLSLSHHTRLLDAGLFAIWLLFLGHFHRCERLHISIAHAIPVIVPPKPLPNLKHLHLVVQEDQPLENYEGFGNLVVHAPGLKNLQLQCPDLGLIADKLHLLNVPNLTHVSLHLSNSEHHNITILDFLDHCAALVYLQVVISLDVAQAALDFRPPPSFPILLPSLRYLRTNSFELYTRLSAPSLDTFSLLPRYGRPGLDHAPYSAQWLNALELELQNTTAQTPEYPEAFWNTPAVELANEGDAQKFFGALVRRAGFLSVIDLTGAGTSPPHISSPRVVRLSYRFKWPHSGLSEIPGLVAALELYPALELHTDMNPEHFERVFERFGSQIHPLSVGFPDFPVL